jgi:hypothetical protein
MTPEPVLARKMWRTLEPYHAMIYFVPEAETAYAAVGLRGRRAGYFASRSAALGIVPVEVVIATFFNFSPALVRRAMAGVWNALTPEALVAARLHAADAALRRILDDRVHGREVAEAAELAREATTACTVEGRPLFAGHAALPWPTEPHLVLWHAITLLREHRGDGHVAALGAEGVSGCEALLLHAATGDVPTDLLRVSRAWPDDEWEAARSRLRARGWLAPDGSFTEAGREHRDRVEDRTDAVALPPWAHLGQERSDRLRELVRPLSRTIVEASTFAASRSFWEE